MTQVVNFDALQDEPPFILEIGGKSHPMKIASIQDFVENMRLIETLGANSSFLDELEVSVKVIARAFPTLTEDEIRGWQVGTIDKLFKLSRGENIFETPEAKAEGEVGNAPAAS